MAVAVVAVPHTLVLAVSHVLLLINPKMLLSTCNLSNSNVSNSHTADTRPPSASPLQQSAIHRGHIGALLLPRAPERTRSGVVNSSKLSLEFSPQNQAFIRSRFI
jgi:hypothetical protein